MLTEITSLITAVALVRPSPPARPQASPVKKMERQAGGGQSQEIASATAEFGVESGACQQCDPGHAEYRPELDLRKYRR
jgi:hypothetical protein